MQGPGARGRDVLMLMDSGSREWQLLSWPFRVISVSWLLPAPMQPETCWERFSQPSVGQSGLQTTDLIPLNLFSHLKRRPLTCQRL